MIKKALAFTLAEVLITMSIVGVVAALTIPTLHYQKTKKEYSTKLKNFFSKMDNAVLEMQVEKGSFRDMKKPTEATKIAWYMDNIDPYMGHDYVKGKRVYFKDGSYFSINNIGGCQDMVYDVNGEKKPNSTGKDQFRFLYCFDDNNRIQWFGNAEVFFGTYGSGMHSMSRPEMISKCRSNKHYCSKLLQNDLWEFKDDYPIKF